MKFPLAILLACAALSLAAVDLPMPAQIVRADNGSSIDNALVSSETLDQIDYAIGEGGQAKSSLKRSAIARVVYAEVADSAMAKAKGFATRNETEKAAQAYVQAAVTSPYWRVREESYLLAAEGLRTIGKPDEALKALAELEAKAPRSTFLPRALSLRVQILMSKGDRAGATAAITALAAFDQARAAVAKANVLRNDKKAAEAASELASVWGTLVKPGVDNAGDPEAPSFESVGFQLVADREAAGNAAGAKEALLTLCYAPIAKSAQSKAHLALATALSAASDKATLLSAFDHAIMAGALPGGDRGGAKKAAQKILEKFDKLPEMKDEVGEYRVYVNAL